MSVTRYLYSVASPGVWVPCSLHRLKHCMSKLIHIMGLNFDTLWGSIGICYFSEIC